MDKYDRRLISKLGYNPDKSIVYQSLKTFLYPSFLIEKINPEHKAILYAKKKKRYAKSKARNYEKVALLIRYMLPLFAFSYFLLAFTYSILAPSKLAYLLSQSIILIAIMLAIAVLHELLHIAVFEKLKIDYEINPIPKKLPLVVQLRSRYFNKPFSKLDKAKKLQYLSIAIAPYTIIFPLACLFILLPNLTMQISGYILLFSHLLNLPLEFI